MVEKKTEVGSPMNFRGMIYKPINEQGVIYLFSLVAEDLNLRVESIQQGYPDCTGLKYKGNGRWERVKIEFENKASNFLNHMHDPKECDIIICWNDDLSDKQKEELAKENVEIIALEDRINTDEIPNKELPDPETSSKEEFDLKHHYEENNMTSKTKKLFNYLDSTIKQINSEIWDKYSKTAITYYSPEKMFVFVRPRKTSIAINLFTNKEDLEGFENIPNHENWGRCSIHNEEELEKIKTSLKRSFDIMKKAEQEGINTGWYALTPKEKMHWVNKAEDSNDEEDEGEE